MLDRWKVFTFVWILFSVAVSLPAGRVSNNLLAAFEFLEGQSVSPSNLQLRFSKDSVSSSIVGNLTWNGTAATFISDRVGIQLSNSAHAKNETVKSTRDCSLLSQKLRQTSAMTVEMWLQNSGTIGAALSLTSGRPGYNASICAKANLEVFPYKCAVPSHSSCLVGAYSGTQDALVQVVITFDGVSYSASWNGVLLRYFASFNFSFPTNTFLRLGMPAVYSTVPRSPSVYTGQVYFVAFYNRVLSNLESQQNYNVWLSNSKPFIRAGQTAHVFEDRLQNISLSAFVFDFDNFAKTQFAYPPTALRTPQPITFEVVSFRCVSFVLTACFHRLCCLQWSGLAVQRQQQQRRPARARWR